MSAEQAWFDWQKHQGGGEHETQLPRTIAAIASTFPLTAEVELFQLPGRGDTLRVIFTPSPQSPFVFETFAFGYDHVTVYDKTRIIVPKSHFAACCDVLFHSAADVVGFIETSYIADAFEFSDFDNPVRVRELIASNVKRQARWNRVVSADDTLNSACCIT